MPQKHIRDEEKWTKAKKIVKKQYNKTEADGDEFWELVMGVYKQARGTIHKKGKGTYYHHKRGGKDVKRKLEEGREQAPKSRKALLYVVLEKSVKKGDLPPEGDFKRIKRPEKEQG